MYNDIYLIDKIRNGNYNAFGLLINKYRSYVFSILMQLLKSKEEAEEAYQDTFMKVYRSLDQYSDTSKFSSWLYRIAYNTGLDYIKKRKRTTELIENQNMAQEAIEDPVEQNDLKNILSQLIKQLPPEEATIITMFYFDELNIKEMAKITGLTESNLKTKLFRARNKLREMIPGDKIASLKSYYHG